MQTNPKRLDDDLARMAGGDQAALADLYAATRAAVFGFALSLLKNAHDAEDVLQDTYIVLWQAAKDYVSMGKPMAWILTVTRSLCLQKLRQHKRQTDLPPEDWELWLQGKAGLSQEDRIALRQCLEQLDDRERQIIVLHAVAGLKHREIAALLDIPLSTALSKYHRGLKKLRQHL